MLISNLDPRQKRLGTSIMHRKGTFPHKDVPLRSGEVAVSPYSIETEKLSKMRKQEFVSNEEQGKTANETEINNLSDT